VLSSARAWEPLPEELLDLLFITQPQARSLEAGLGS
jgi:hypothetical protein